MKFDAIKNYSRPTQMLIEYHVAGAIDFITDMDLDAEKSEIDNRTVHQYRDMVHDVAIDFLAQDLDFESGDIDSVPGTMKACIRNFIDDNVTLRAEFR